MHGERQRVVDRAVLYLRSLLPDGYSQQQAATLDRVAELVDRGVVGDRQVRVCGCQVPASPAATRTSAGERIVTRLAACREWASVNDCSLAPAMEFRNVDDSLSGAHYRAVRLPAILLVEYRDGALWCVTPHRDGDTPRTVEDRLDELATGEPTAFEPLSREPPATLPVAIDQTGQDEPDDESADDPENSVPITPQ